MPRKPITGINGRCQRAGFTLPSSEALFQKFPYAWPALSRWAGDRGWTQRQAVGEMILLWIAENPLDASLPPRFLFPKAVLGFMESTGWQNPKKFRFWHMQPTCWGDLVRDDPRNGFKLSAQLKQRAYELRIPFDVMMQLAWAEFLEEHPEEGNFHGDHEATLNCWHIFDMLIDRKYPSLPWIVEQPV